MASVSRCRNPNRSPGRFYGGSASTARGNRDVAVSPGGLCPHVRADVDVWSVGEASEEDSESRHEWHEQRPLDARAAPAHRAASSPTEDPARSAVADNVVGTEVSSQSSAADRGEVRAQRKHLIVHASESPFIDGVRASALAPDCTYTSAFRSFGSTRARPQSSTTADQRFKNEAIAVRRSRRVRGPSGNANHTPR